MGVAVQWWQSVCRARLNQMGQSRIGAVGGEGASLLSEDGLGQAHVFYGQQQERVEGTMVPRARQQVLCKQKLVEVLQAGGFSLVMCSLYDQWSGHAPWSGGDRSHNARHALVAHASSLALPLPQAEILPKLCSRK